MTRTWIAGLLTSAALFVTPAPQTPQTPQEETLARLEAALAADADDLRSGSEYRMAIVASRQYDRALAFLKDLTAAHPDASNAHLNYGFAFVDKIPSAGAISQVILANSALGEFSRALELRPTWIGYYARGSSYLYWPKVFGRTYLGIADLDAAMAIQRADAKRAYHVRTFIALGDGYWLMDQAVKARATWREGLKQFPGNGALKTRAGASAAALTRLMSDIYDPSRRVDTNLEELWAR